MTSNYLIEQKITTPILYNIFQFSLSGFVSKYSSDKIQYIKNQYLQENGQENVNTFSPNYARI